MTMVNPYLRVRKIGDTGKTAIYAVDSAQHGDRLGEIKWYGPWRQYCFYPKAGCVFNNDCLQDIARTCRQLTNEHRRRAQSLRPGAEVRETPARPANPPRPTMGRAADARAG